MQDEKEAIRELTEEVRLLRQVVEGVQKDLAYYRDNDPADHEAAHPAVPGYGDAEPAAESKPESAPAEPAPAESAPAESKGEDAITRDDLSKRCLTLIRDNKVEKSHLITIMEEATGAKTIKQMPDDKLAAFAAELDKLEANQ